MPEGMHARDMYPGGGPDSSRRPSGQAREGSETADEGFFERCLAGSRKAALMGYARSETDLPSALVISPRADRWLPRHWTGARTGDGTPFRKAAFGIESGSSEATLAWREDLVA